LKIQARRFKSLKITDAEEVQKALKEKVDLVKEILIKQI